MQSNPLHGDVGGDLPLVAVELIAEEPLIAKESLIANESLIAKE